MLFRFAYVQHQERRDLATNKNFFSIIKNMPFRSNESTTIKFLSMKIIVKIEIDKL